jgi:hypothetical protein
MSSKMRFLVAGITLMMILPGAGVRADVSLFLLHHSTGRYFIEEGNVRQVIASMEEEGGPRLKFWDHDYVHIGLMDPDGNLLSYNYGLDLLDTEPVDLHNLWTTANSARDSILNNHQVIAFKSCYSACEIVSDSMLGQYKTWYSEMAEVFDQHPDKIFVVVSPPPLHRLDTDLGEADRSRNFANWLGDEFLVGHPNIWYFNLFDLLAQADDGSSTRNMLQYDFEKSHSSSDNHPNEQANILAGQAFAEVMVGAGLVPVQKTSLNSFKAKYR